MRKTAASMLLACMLLVAALVGSVAYGQDTPRYGGTFTFAVATTPPSMDWHTVSAKAVQLYGGMYIWEALFALDSGLTPRPMLVESWEIAEDGLTWTFKLREGVPFHNGKEMTSADVVASLRRWLDVSPMASTMDRVTSVDAVDAYSVRFTLSAPLATLPYLLASETAQAVVMPQEIVEGAGPGALSEYIGTGPYKLAEWVTDRHIALERFDDYAARDEDWGGVAGRKEAYLDRIVFRSIPEAEVRLAGLETGEFQAAQPLPADYYDLLDRAPRAEPVIVEFDLKPVIYFSMEGIMADPRMRKAIRAALDTDEIMFASTGDERFYDLNPDQLWYRFQAFWSDTGAEVYNQADPELAMRLAREAGYNGEPIRFLASSTQYHHRQPSIIINEQLTDAGFNIVFDLRDWPTVSQLQNNDPNAWDITYIRTGLMMPAEIEFVRLFGFDSPETQEAVDALFEAVEFEEIREILEEFKREVLVEQVPWYTFGDMFALRGVATNVRGLQDLYSHPLWGVWLTD